MKMYIPKLGDEIILIKEWCFLLYGEDRNHTLFKRFGISVGRWRRNELAEIQEILGNGKEQQESVVTCVLPIGTQLKVSRIYIRQGQDNYNSVTFSGKEIGRFWAKLDDVNEIDHPSQVFDNPDRYRTYAGPLPERNICHEEDEPARG